MLGVKAASTEATDRRRGPLWPALLVLVSSIALSVAAAYGFLEAARTRDRLRFQSSTFRIRMNIEGRLETYVAMLRSGRALFDVTGDLTRAQFHTFIERLEVGERYPGIQGIGFSVRVLEGGRPSLTRRMQAEGFPRFTLWPDTPRDEYHAIIYLEPLDLRNQFAIGYDMYSEPTRREAMSRARDTGQPAASGRVTLVQEIDEQKQAGFLIYVPVYEGGGVPETVEERRRLLRGFVYSPFRAGDLLNGIFGAHHAEAVAFEVFDGETASPEALLYSSEAAGGPALLTAEEIMTIAGRPWTVRFATTSAFEAGSARRLTAYLFGIGLVVSFWLFGLTRSQTRARARAERIADELRASELALRESEARLSRLLDAHLIGIGVLLADFTGRVRDANDAFLETTGYTREDLESGGINFVELTPPELRHLDEEAMRQMRAVGAHAPYEKEYIRKDGTRVPVLVATAYLGGPEEIGAGFILDLSERKRAEHERAVLLERERAARAEAEAASRAKDEFLATLSHELRTPLNAILGWARLVHSGHLDENERRRALQTIERNAVAQARLIEDLLDISRIVSGKVRLNLRSFQIDAVVTAALDAVRPSADARQVALVVEPGDTSAGIVGDPDRLQQVIWNVLSNAVKFTPAGGTVSVRTRRGDDEVQIEIADTGQGIEPTVLPFVFDRFRQADGSITRRHGGLGLGLAIARHLVELHKGSIRAESDGPGRGSTFTIALPLDVALESGGGGAEDANGWPDLSGIRALLVDDDPDALGLLEFVLRQCGAEVRTASSAAMAVEALRGWDAGLLVSDIGMPVEDGYSLMRRVRAGASEDGGHARAIAVTAFAGADARLRAIEAGYDAHIPKPIDPGALASLAAELLGRRRAPGPRA